MHPHTGHLLTQLWPLTWMDRWHWLLFLLLVSPDVFLYRAQRLRPFWYIPDGEKKSYSDFSFFKSDNRIGSSTFLSTWDCWLFVGLFLEEKKRGGRTDATTSKLRIFSYFVCVIVVNWTRRHFLLSSSVSFFFLICWNPFISSFVYR